MSTNSNIEYRAETMTAVGLMVSKTLTSNQKLVTYENMLEAFEKPLLNALLVHCRGSQTKVAEILGLNRGTLRKKLKKYGFISEKE